MYREKAWWQLPTIMKTINVRQTRHAGHCWRSRDEPISDVLLWTPSYGWAKAGWPARTYIQQLWADTECKPEDLLEAMAIGRGSERGSGISMLMLHDDDDDGCTTWTLTKRLKKKLDGNYTRMLRAMLNKSCRQHPTRHQLYGHLPPIMKTIQVRRTRHAGHCWRSKDELISDVLLWIPAYDQAKAGRPAWTYIQQLCEDTGCNPEDLPKAMNDREKWRERVRDICAGGTTWWWWYIYVYIYKFLKQQLVKTVFWEMKGLMTTYFFIKV